MKVSPKHLKYLSDDGGRPFIVEAVENTVQRYLEDPTDPVGHSVPPRCGKSSIITMIAAELSAIGCPMTFVIAPWSFLTDQLINTDKVRGTFVYYAPDAELMFSPDKVENIKHHMFFKREDPSVKMLTMTNALVHCNVDTFCRGIETIIDQYQKPPCVIADEVHLIALQDDGWGNTINKIIKAGAFFVGLTGTATTQDKRDIPGFIYEKCEDSETKSMTQKRFDNKSTRVTEEGDVYKKFEEFKGLRDEYQIRAKHGVNVPWKMAFDKGWLVRMNIHLLEMEVENKAGEKKNMSSIPDSEINGKLGDWVREECVMRSVLTDAIHGLVNLTTHAGSNNCPTMPRMLVVTSPDRNKGHDGKSNHQARAAMAIAKEIIENDVEISTRLKGKRLVMEIATSVTEDGEADKSVTDKLKRFAEGQIDILFVKAIGLVGLDVPECKVLANLSEYRKGPMLYQLLTRIGTPWGSDKDDALPGEKWAYNVQGLYIGPKDSRHVEIKATIDQMGGLSNRLPFTEWEREGDGEQKIEHDDNEEWSVASAIGVMFATETGDSVDASLDELATIHSIRYRYPETTKLSDVDLLRLYNAGAFPVEKTVIEKYKQSVVSKVKITNPAEKREKLKGAFGMKAKNIVNRYIPYRKDDATKRYVRAVSLIQTMAKSHCHVYIDVPSIDDPDKLQTLVDALDIVEKEFAKAVGRGEI